MFPQDAKSGSILFGGIDTAKYEGDLTSLALYPTQSDGIIREFAVSFTSLAITSDSGTSNLTTPDFAATTVLLDSGSTSSVLPDDITHALYNVVGAVYVGLGLAVLPCNMRNTPGTLDIGFGGPNGPTIKIPLSELILPFGIGTAPPNWDDKHPEEGLKCQFSVTPASQLGGTGLIFGDSILRSMYIVYDLANKRVAVAPTRFNATDSNVVAFPSLNASIPSATSVQDEVPASLAPSSSVVQFDVGTSTVPEFTGTAGLALQSAFSEATAGSTPTSKPTGSSAGSSSGTSAPSSTATKKGAGNVVKPFASEQLALLVLVTGLMAMGGVFLL
jgi:hypothetical protein